MPKAFLVQRLNWWRVGRNSWLRMPGEVAIAVFDTRDEAVAAAAERESHARRVVIHPFRCGTSLFEVSTLPECNFVEILQDADIESPVPDPEGTVPWRTWAELYSVTWSDQQLTRLWEAATRVRFYQVEERTTMDVCCLVRITWELSESSGEYQPEVEGGTPFVLWNSHDRAVKDCADKNLLAVDEMRAAALSTGNQDAMFSPRNRMHTLSNPFADCAIDSERSKIDNVPHVEIMTVQRSAYDRQTQLGQHAYVVLRRGWTWRFFNGAEATTESDAMYFCGTEHGGIPICVYSEQQLAQQHAHEREKAWRAVANPFRFDWTVMRDMADGSQSGGREVELIQNAMQRLGLTAPKIDPATANHLYADWSTPLAAWWSQNVLKLTAEQREAIWSWFPNLSFYEVRKIHVGDNNSLVERPCRVKQKFHVAKATTWHPQSGPQYNPHRFLGAFADRKVAEARREAAEYSAHQQVTPLPMLRTDHDDFRWDSYSSLPKSEVVNRMVELRMFDEHPGKEFVPDIFWWEEHCPRFSQSQRLGFWKMLDRIRLFEILEFEVEGTGMNNENAKHDSLFILVRSDWSCGHAFWFGDYTFLRGYCTREEAEAAIPGRPLGQCFGAAEQFYEVVEVQIEK